MNNPYNMWAHPPPGSMNGFNSPPGRNWSPFPPPPVQQPSHMAPRGPPHFTPPPPPMHQSFSNSFCQPQSPMMGNLQSVPRFTQFQFHPNQNGFNNNNHYGIVGGGGVNMNKSNQYGYSSPSSHIQNNRQNPPYQQRDKKKQGNQNQHANENGNKNQNGKKKNKNKSNQRELPENCAFYCDTCDRGFKTEDKFQEHVDGHEKCKEEGCSYIAAPKLVQLHIRNHHNTGLAKKIWSVESKEDIQKWIAERKKNFPTAANIEKKQTLLAEKKARGEVIDEKQFYHRPNDQRHKRKGPWWKRQRGEFNNSNSEGSPPEKKKLMEKEENQLDEKQICDKKDEKTEPLDPLSTILDSDSVQPANDADLEKQDKLSSSTTSKSPLVHSSLKALQTVYDSDEDNEKNSNDNSGPSSTDSQCKSVVLKELKDSSNHNQQQQHHQKRLGKTRHQMLHEEAEELAKRPWKSKVFTRERPTLLEKLLAKEIRHERNVILQCIRHVVKNNFFENQISVCTDE